jgi:hypothetical protein
MWFTISWKLKLGGHWRTYKFLATTQPINNPHRSFSMRGK